MVDEDLLVNSRLGHRESPKAPYLEATGVHEPQWLVVTGCAPVSWVAMLTHVYTHTHHLQLDPDGGLQRCDKTHQ